jgi:hypothetical protein
MVVRGSLVAARGAAEVWRREAWCSLVVESLT